MVTFHHFPLVQRALSTMNFTLHTFEAAVHADPHSFLQQTVCHFDNLGSFAISRYAVQLYPYFVHPFVDCTSVAGSIYTNYSLHNFSMQLDVHYLNTLIAALVLFMQGASACMVLFVTSTAHVNECKIVSWRSTLRVLQSYPAFIQAGL